MRDTKALTTHIWNNSYYRFPEFPSFFKNLPLGHSLSVHFDIGQLVDFLVACLGSGEEELSCC